MSTEDYCDLCDLPKSTCIHGQPPPPVVATPAPRATPVVRRSTARATTPAKPARSVPRKWTPPEAFQAEILAVLHEAGGVLQQDDLYLELEARMEERLKDADRETTPEGELRWRLAARKARQALIAQGVMTKGAPGVWALADRA